MVRDLLFELGTEELPSGVVLPLATALAEQLTTRLDKAGVAHGHAQFFATPRRLAVWVHDVVDTQKNQRISRRGPAFDAGFDAKGAPTAALSGFAKSCGVELNALTTVETDKGRWWLYEADVPGEKTRVLLPTLLAESLAALPIAKPMRWGLGDVAFARPVHWAVLLWGDERMTCDVLGVETGRESVGHRFHHPQAVSITKPSAYEALLRDAYVIADFATRRQQIVEQVQTLAEAAGLEAVMPEALLDEVTAIVEWPVALILNFSAEFLQVPADALIASMQSHQKCFALRDAKGALMPCFITVSNIQSTAPQSVVAGNEKVMRARLSDAAFFYQQDRQKPLHAYREATAQVLFQAKLGSLLDKSNRLCTLMSEWAPPLQLSRVDALRAATLSKCDLMTGMVGEFPELQGLMGYDYAQHDGETDAVALALTEQYQPRFSADDLPTSILGFALSLADRLDTLVGAFAIGQKPTGVKDPYKLRRHALAVIRLLIQMPNLSLLTLIEQTRQAYGATLQVDASTMEALRLFILDRLFAYYEGQHVTADVVHAVRARQADDLFDANRRLQALQSFVSTPSALHLSAACKRVTHLLHQVAHQPNDVAIDPSLLIVPAERTLLLCLETVERDIAPLIAAHAYEKTLLQLATLREPLDAFFEHVMVMVDDAAQRHNRLNLLARLQWVLQCVADISMLSM